MVVNARSFVKGLEATSTKPKNPCESDSTESLWEQSGGVPSKPPKLTATGPGGLSPPRVDSHKSDPPKRTASRGGTLTRNFCPGGAEIVSTNWLLVSKFDETDGSTPTPPEF